MLDLRLTRIELDGSRQGTSVWLGQAGFETRLWFDDVTYWHAEVKENFGPTVEKP